MEAFLREVAVYDDYVRGKVEGELSVSATEGRVSNVILDNRRL